MAPRKTTKKTEETTNGSGGGGAGALARYAAKTGALTISKEAMAAKLSGTKKHATGADGVFLRFSGKQGKYAYGKDGRDITPDMIWVIDPNAATEGWIFWKGAKPAGKHVWSIYRDDIDGVDYADLEDIKKNKESDAGWEALLGWGILDLTLPEQGHVTFETNSKSGRNVFSAINDEIATRLTMNEPAYAVISLSCEEFEAQDQINYKPVVEVLAWVTEKELEAYFEDADGTPLDLIEGKYSAKPVRKATAKAAPRTRRAARAV